jgi:GNAT superfamily N-acetyltransferase
MTAINSALEVDLTGQATAESIGETAYSGVGGLADFMRGAALARGGKTILAFPSTAVAGSRSRIVPALSESATVSLVQGDLQYVVTEYGIAHLQAKTVRERAMALVSVAHPTFRGWLLEEARRRKLVFEDQAFIAGADYPEELDQWRTTAHGLDIRLRPVRINDEPLLKEFFYALSDETLFRRFVSTRKDIPHQRLQEFVVIDYQREFVLAATVALDVSRELVVGVAQYAVTATQHTAEVALVTRDDYQNRGVGTEMLRTMIRIARQQGLLAFSVEVLLNSAPILHILEREGFDMEPSGGFDDALVCRLRLLIG